MLTTAVERVVYVTPFRWAVHWFSPGSASVELAASLRGE
jgi:hypothetical protein